MGRWCTAVARTCLAMVTALSTIVAVAQETPAVRSRTFGEDVAFLQRHVEVIVLAGESGQAQLAVVPAYQGRVMTSTAAGPGGTGHGFINDEAVAAGPIAPQINVFGGEDRFWLGPEGGQFAIFFPPGEPFDLDHWQTPPAIDTAPYDVVAQSDTHVEFAHRARITNYHGFEFDVAIRRIVRLLDRQQAAAHLGVPPAEVVALVAYQSENTITNTGQTAWTKENGLLSIWILGMLKHSPTATVVIPFRRGAESEFGPVVNDAYFGKVPDDRLKIDRDRGVLTFRADGQYRSKIGLSRRRVRDVAGSYDPARRLLTILQFTRPDDATNYVNSMWEIQDEPYGGDVVNSYNDGPPEPGAKPLGPFYELETSSPAAALAAGQSLTHVHRTIHLAGPTELLDPIAEKVFGLGLDDIAAALAD